MSSYPTKQVIVIRKDLKMRRGKEIAQGAHASMAAIINYATWNSCTVVIDLKGALKEWLSGKFAKIVCYVNSENELDVLYAKAVIAGFPCALITDSGITEFKGVPTKTALAIGPSYSNEFHLLTDHLPLY